MNSLRRPVKLPVLFHYLLVVLLCLISSLLLASEVSPQQAQAVASQFLNKQNTAINGRSGTLDLH